MGEIWPLGHTLLTLLVNWSEQKLETLISLVDSGFCLTLFLLLEELPLTFFLYYYFTGNEFFHFTLV
jgi:hypothetical protein